MLKTDEPVRRLQKVAERLGRCPQKKEVPEDLVVCLKALYGPWPRVLEAAGLAEKPRGASGVSVPSPLGVCMRFGYPLSAEESLSRIRDAGFDEVVLPWDALSDRETFRQLMKLAGGLGLRADEAAFRPEGADALWLPGPAGDDYAARLEEAVNGCADAGGAVLSAALTEKAPPRCSPCGIERLIRVVDAARRRGVVLAFENGLYPAHLNTVLKVFRSPEVGFCYSQRLRQSDLPLLAKHSARLATAHVFSGALWAAKGLVDAGYAGRFIFMDMASDSDRRRLTAEDFLSHVHRSALRFRSQFEQNAGQL